MSDTDPLYPNNAAVCSFHYILPLWVERKLAERNGQTKDEISRKKIIKERIKLKKKTK
jgi:hypothetical protein